MNTLMNTRGYFATIPVHDAGSGPSGAPYCARTTCAAAPACPGVSTNTVA